MQLLHKAPVHEHVNERKQLVRDLAAGMGAVGVQLLPGEAGKAQTVLPGSLSRTRRRKGSSAR